MAQLLNLKKYIILSIALLILLLIVYIMQVNVLARDVYAVKDCELRLMNAMQENESLEINFSKVTSLANVDRYLGDQTFEKVNSVKYIQILDTSVAVK